MPSGIFWLSVLWTSVLLSRPCFPFRHEAVSSATVQSGDESLLEVFQVYPPPLSLADLVGSTRCSFTLMNHVFADSAGKPYMGTYEPRCGNDWDAAVLNFSAVSYGRQFDRLGSIWIADTEVWRTCTAEPLWSGIHFTFSKDITAFKALLNSPQSLVVDLGNYIVGPYNGSFNVTLSITFYNVLAPLARTPSDEIISLSKRLKDGRNTHFDLPTDDSSISISIPQNASRLVLEVLASGNGQEEFWYSNVPNDYVDTFQNWNISFLGQGSFREVMIYIDKRPIAAVWPFEVVFTGGICPGFWRPIVGHRTFDLPTYRIDMSPFIPLLRKGNHQIEFAVLGGPQTLHNWYVSGRLHIWHSNRTIPPNPPLTHESYISPKANITMTGSVASDNTSFFVNSSASRQDKYYNLKYNNQQSYELIKNGIVLVQNITQITIFDSPLSHGQYRLNLLIKETDNQDGTILLDASISQTFHRVSTNILDGLVETEHAEVRSIGTLSIAKKTNRSNGNTSVIVTYNSPRREYLRDVKAIEFQIVSDYEMDRSIGLIDHEGIQLQTPDDP